MARPTPPKINQPAMKTPILWIALAATSFAGPLVPNKSITANELAAKQANDALSTLPQTAVLEKELGVEAPRPAAQSIIAQSEIITDGENWTLVPKGAVLFVPERNTENVGTKPVGSLLMWREFLAKNPAWVSTHEVSYEQATGETPLPEGSMEHWQKRNCIVVAVHRGGPISLAR